MKTTQATTFRSLNSELNKINNQLEDLRIQEATGKKLNRPSDDPAAIRPVLSSRSQIRATDRYISSLSTAIDRLDNQDSYLDQVENLMVSAKEVTINAINGAMSDVDLNSLADQISYIKEEMLSVANAQVGGQYIFAGFLEDTQPFVQNGDIVSYQGDGETKQLESAPGEYIATNLAGSQIFQGLKDTNDDGVLEATGLDLFATLTDLERAIRGQSGSIYNGSTMISSDLVTTGTDGDPIALVDDGTGVPLVDINGDQVSYTTSDGNAINLQPVMGVDGHPLTIEEYNAQFPPGITDYDTNPISDLTQPMYVNSDGTIPEYNNSGEPVLRYESAVGVFTEVSLLNADDTPMQLRPVPELNDLLTTLESGADQVRTDRGRLGNNAARLERSKEHLESVSIDLQQILSRYEDVDIIDVITEITQTETALEAALSVTGRVGQLSILDYL
nr:flagellar hook-associated protein FlgL [uncultured Desulfuromonas sp.]